MNENNEVRYCKKCGCELMSTNKKKKCENCRCKTTQSLKKVGGVVVGVVGVVVALVQSFGSEKNGEDDEIKKQ